MDIEIGKNPKALRRLRTKCEKVKRNLTSNTSVVLDYDLGDDDFTIQISRAKFEELCAVKFKECIDCVENCLKDAKLGKHQIDEVVLVGGSTRIPKIKEMLSEYFGGKKLNESINPDEAVANGATVQAALILGAVDEEITDIILVDVTPLSLGVEIIGGVMSVIVPRNTSIPIIKEK